MNQTPFAAALNLCPVSLQVLGSRWSKPPPKVQGGRRVWTFGHKLYALMMLKEFENKKKFVANVTLKHWDLSVSFLRDWSDQEQNTRTFHALSYFKYMSLGLKFLFLCISKHPGDCIGGGVGRNVLGTIRLECQKLVAAGASALGRARLSSAGGKAKYLALETEAVAWLDAQLAAGRSVHPTVFWDKVRELGTQHGVDQTKFMKKNWQRRFKRRHNIRFRATKRISSLTEVQRASAIDSFLTYLRLAGRFWGTERVLNTDECPLSFDGEITRYAVLRNGAGDTVSNEPSSHAKRFCTYMPMIGVTTVGGNASMKPVVIFKGKGFLPQHEQTQYDDRVIVFFQENAVTDGPLLIKVLQKWFSANASACLFIWDAARQHWTDFQGFSFLWLRNTLCER